MFCKETTLFNPSNPFFKLSTCIELTNQYMLPCWREYSIKEITCLTLFFKLSACIELIKLTSTCCLVGVNTAYQLGYTSSALTEEARLFISWDILFGGSLISSLVVSRKEEYVLQDNFIYSGQKPISHDWQAIASNREYHIPLSYWTAYFKYHTGSASVVILSLALTIFFIQENKKQAILLSILRKSFQKLTEKETHLKQHSIGH